MSNQFKIAVIIFLFIIQQDRDLFGQNDPIYFFDFEDNKIDYSSPGRQILIHNNKGSFKDIEPYLPLGRTVVSPITSYRYSLIEFGTYSVGKGYLYHSPSWYLTKDKGVSFNHIELNLDTALQSGRFYKFSFLIGNFKSHRFKPSHYGVKFSNEKIIKSEPGGLLSEPDIFFNFKKEHQLEEIQAIYYAENPVKYIYFGIFEEDTVRLPKAFIPVIYRGISYSDTAAHVLSTKPTRVILDNILIEEMEKDEIEFRDVYFDTNKDQLYNPSDLVLIKEISDYLMNHPKKFILIQGFTDREGTLAYNLDLSERRAEGIKSQLIMKGVSERQIMTLGRGIHDAQSANKDSKYDRKVSFLVFE